jgi:DNA-directed RNA polymerase beta subunit
MESCAFVAHGVSSIVKERLMDVSDRFVTTVCDNCGFIVKNKDQPMTCSRCKTSKIVTTILPYAFKLLQQELKGFGIAARIKF